MKNMNLELYFCIMRKSIILHNRILSGTLLLIYLFGSLSLFSFHSHSINQNDQDYCCDHHDEEINVLFCEALFQKINFEKECSHDSHLATTLEKCNICDHFSNVKFAFLDKYSNLVFKSLTSIKHQSFDSLNLIDFTSFQNKSPPFII